MLAHEVRFEDDQLIFVDGQNSRALYLLIEGSVAVELRTTGFVVCVQALGPGQVFGWSSLLDDQDTLFQVRAREQIRALKINGAELSSLQLDSLLWQPANSSVSSKWSRPA